jgi:hypothetical protein
MDAHVRIANVGHRNVPSDDQAPDGELGGFGPAANRGPNGREWHTDWPHDLSERGKHAQGGPIRQPFPDVCMCLSMVWNKTRAAWCHSRQSFCGHAVRYSIYKSEWGET